MCIRDRHYTLISDDYQRIVKYEYATGRAVDTLFDIATARECDLQAIWDYDIAPSGHHILIYSDIQPIYRRSYTLRATHYDVRRNLCEPLTEGDIMIPTFSPDGRMVAFVRDNNIYIKKFDFNSEVQVTTDGKRNEVINGSTDWVYEEEFSTTRLMEWSPQSDFLAFVRSDESLSLIHILCRLLLEEVLYVVIWYHLLLEGISTSLRRLDHLDNLRV